MRSGVKGEIDMVGYDGPVLAFVEVKTRAAGDRNQPSPEDAVNDEKRRNLARMARQFLRARRIDSPSYRFDVLAIETRPRRAPRSPPAQRSVRVPFVLSAQRGNSPNRSPLQPQRISNSGKASHKCSLGGRSFSSDIDGQTA